MAATAAWTAAGASPLLVLVALVGPGRLRPLLTWVPDALIAACAAAAAGAALPVLRLVLAVPARRRSP
ncbi:hypothetical protein [Actinomadura verrucosospora]